jgi:DNA repair protein RecN (Recombination protein N)
MLQSLYIQNFALIEATEVSFNSGFTVITGETGAGKSILLGALGLTLGVRADVSLLQEKSKKCVIEAKFNIKALKLNEFFNENELDYDDVTTIRREITPDGKSRAFINDTPTNISLLKELGSYLIDIHSQHETLLLKEMQFQFELVDAFAKTTSSVANYKLHFKNLQILKNQLQEYIQQEIQSKKDLDYYQFQFNELEESNIVEGELQKLENESEVLENAEFIKNNLSKNLFVLSGSEENIISAISNLKQQLQSITKYGNQYQDLFNRANSISIDLKELANDIEQLEESVMYNPNRLEVITQQLDKLNRLLKKHGVKNELELLSIKKDIENKLEQFNSIEENIKNTEKEIKTLEKKCKEFAQEISSQRKKSIPEIENQINLMLNGLSMPNAKFKIDFITNNTLSINGFDELKFLFTANKGTDYKELHKTASGGELSRLMLCLKSQLAKKTALSTIIFDEIDTGVSGEVADKIGNILLSMGENMQVIAITHLPQMASKGNNHLFVYKSDTKDKTISSIKTLNNDERINEIAKMLSAGKPTEIALKNAKELLNA